MSKKKNLTLKGVRVRLQQISGPHKVGMMKNLLALVSHLGKHRLVEATRQGQLTLSHTVELLQLLELSTCKL